MNDNMTCPKCGPVDNDRCGECHICGFPTYDAMSNKKPLEGAGRGWFCYHKNGWTSEVVDVDNAKNYPYELTLNLTWRYKSDGTFTAREGGNTVSERVLDEWAVYLAVPSAQKGTLEWAWQQRRIGRYIWHRETGTIKDYPETKKGFLAGRPKGGWEISRFEDVEVNDIAVFENTASARVTKVIPKDRLFRTGTNDYSDEKVFWRMSDGTSLSEGMTRVIAIVKPQYLGWESLYDKEGRSK